MASREAAAMVRDLPVLERELHRIRAETVILTGAADRTIPPAAVRMLATQIPGARLVVLPGTGHLLPQLRPELLVEAILGRELVSAG